MLALLDKSKDPKTALADAWRAPIGAASPLWLMFAGAATAGVTFWWMSRWRVEATNLEAALPLPVVTSEPVALPVEAPVEIAVEAAEAVPAAAEPIPETAPDVVAELAEPVAKPKAAAKPRAATKDADA